MRLSVIVVGLFLSTLSSASAQTRTCIDRASLSPVELRATDEADICYSNMRRRNAASGWRKLTAGERESIAAAVRRRLKDPASAVFEWGPRNRESVVYCGFVNARNSYGGYAGKVPFAVEMSDVSSASRALDVVALESSGHPWLTCADEGYKLD